MAEIKCRACGGPVAFEPGAAEGVCQRCGARQALLKEQDADGLLRQAFLFLENRNWQSADECFVFVLQQDPENALAYFGRLMAELHASPSDDLSEQKEPFDARPSCQQAMRYGDEALRDELASANAVIRARLEAERREQELVRREQELARREQEAARREQTAAKKSAVSEAPTAPVYPKKKALPLILALVAVLLIGGGLLIWRMSGSGQAGQPAEQQPASAAVDTTVDEITDHGDITDQPFHRTVSDVKVAMITDYGDITDQSFNQTTYEACKEYCDANGLPFKYYKPGSDSDDDRITMIENAIEEGFNVIVMPGYACAPAIAATAPNYADVTFIALDVSEFDLSFAGLDPLPANLYSAVYQEELCGYMVGYAAVKLGYKSLGFLGGMAVPAVVRYGYGFVQGCDAAAAELGLSDVTINYAYGNQFWGDADITAAMDTWYAGGTEIVFACGGGIFTSAGEAAAKVGGKVIGVDVDQKGTIDGLYGDGITVTSAMKGLAPTVKTMLKVVCDGKFADYGGKVENLGLVSANPEENYVQLPASTQFSDSFTADDYAALVADMFGGKLTVDNDTTKTAADFATVITVNDLGNLK